MKPTKIINTGLQKPWLLMAIYESMFDKYLTLKKQLWYVTQGAKSKNLPLTLTTQARVERMKERIRETSEALREADQRIHDYIKSHQR